MSVTRKTYRYCWRGIGYDKEIQYYLPITELMTADGASDPTDYLPVSQHITTPEITKDVTIDERMKEDLDNYMEQRNWVFKEEVV